MLMFESHNKSSHFFCSSFISNIPNRTRLFGQALHFQLLFNFMPKTQRRNIISAKSPNQTSRNNTAIVAGHMACFSHVFSSIGLLLQSARPSCATSTIIVIQFIARGSCEIISGAATGRGSPSYRVSAPLFKHRDVR
jgi:hypothetical protein